VAARAATVRAWGSRHEASGPPRFDCAPRAGSRQWAPRLKDMACKRVPVVHLWRLQRNPTSDSEALRPQGQSRPPCNPAMLPQPTRWRSGAACRRAPSASDRSAPRCERDIDLADAFRHPGIGARERTARHRRDGTSPAPLRRKGEAVADWCRDGAATAKGTIERRRRRRLTRTTKALALPSWPGAWQTPNSAGVRAQIESKAVALIAARGLGGDRRQRLTNDVGAGNEIRSWRKGLHGG